MTKVAPPPRTPGATHAERAFETIRGMILDREVVPGDPLQEVELAARLGISRTPVREALNRLEATGLVERQSHRGTFVRRLSSKEVRDIYELAEALEGMVAYLVTAKVAAGDADVTQLQEALAAMESALQREDVDAWVQADREYHETLYALCDSAEILAGIERINLQVDYIRLVYTRNFLNKQDSAADHRAAVEAIASGDAQHARQLTQSHWERIRAEVLQRFIIG